MLINSSEWKSGGAECSADTIGTLGGGTGVDTSYSPGISLSKVIQSSDV